MKNKAPLRQLGGDLRFAARRQYQKDSTTQAASASDIDVEDALRTA